MNNKMSRMSNKNNPNKIQTDKKDHKANLNRIQTLNDFSYNKIDYDNLIIDD